MTCDINNDVLLEIRDELQTLRRELAFERYHRNRPLPPPTPPAPLLPPAAKRSVAGLPSQFLAIMGSGTQWRYFKTHKGWDVFRCNKDGYFVFDDNVDDTSAQITFDEAREVWLRHK